MFLKLSNKLLQTQRIFNLNKIQFLNQANYYSNVSSIEPTQKDEITDYKLHEPVLLAEVLKYLVEETPSFKVRILNNLIIHAAILV